MFYKRLTTLCLLAFVISMFGVYGHWAPDPDAIVHEGPRENLRFRKGREVKYKWKEWLLPDGRTDSKMNVVLSTGVKHKKKIWDNVLLKKVEGDASCGVYSAERFDGVVSKGKYEVHAKARGSLWYRSDKKGPLDYQGTIHKTAEKGAVRYAGAVHPTYSGVHLWGKAKINNQIDSLTSVMDWK